MESARNVLCLEWWRLFLRAMENRQFTDKSWVSGYTYVGRDVAKEVRRGCALPLGFSGPRRPKPTRAKTPAEATETLTEVTTSVRKPTKTRQGSRGPSDHLDPPEKQCPCDYPGAGATGQSVTISDPSVKIVSQRSPDDQRGS